MDILFSQWFSLSIAIAALAGVIVVLVALAKHRQDMQTAAQSIAEAAATAAQQAAEEAAEEASAMAAVRESKKVTNPLLKAHKDILEQFAALEERQEAIDEGFAALREQQAELSKQQAHLGDMQASLEYRQGQLEEETPESRFYQRAAKLVEKGATTEELMHECEIPRNEAELLISLHRRS